MVPAAEPADLVAVLRVYNDVTERLKRSHEALAGEVERLRGELSEKNRELRRREHLAALGQMAAGVAHEIRNPLGGIGIYASILQQELTDRPAQCEIAGRICEGVHNLEKIIRDILAFAGSGTQRCEPLGLRRLLEGVAGQVERKAQERGVDFRVQGNREEITVLGDAGRIERAVINLSFNAVEASKPGGHVWVRGEQGADGLVRITVEDDGPGIDPGVLHKIFHPFFTTKDDGTGLGLAIVHSIAEAHGGYVRAENRPEGGARFELALPKAHGQGSAGRNRPEVDVTVQTNAA